MAVKLKISHIASNRYPLPGPPDRIYAPGKIVLDLTEGMVARGHKVYLFAPTGTKTSAHLIDSGLKSTWEDFREKLSPDSLYYGRWETQYELELISRAFQLANQNFFDIIHAHNIGTVIAPYFASFVGTPIIYTLHDDSNIVKATYQKQILKRFKNSNNYFVSISHSQKQGMPKEMKFTGTVYHGIKVTDFPFIKNPSDYFVFAGRLVRDKGVDIAIDLALKSDQQLKIIGAQDKFLNQRKGISQPDDYWEKEIKPRIDGKRIQYLGFKNRKDTMQLLANAKALFFPIQWSEPFGMVMIEAMACGTPVLAYRRGAVPEIVKDGVTGFVCPPGDEECMLRAIKNIDQIDRQACRKHVEENFTVEKMVDGYERVYQKVLSQKH